MSRSLARDCGFKRVFEYLFNKELCDKENVLSQNFVTPQEIENNFITEEELIKLDAELFNENELSAEELEFSKSILQAVKSNFDDINKKILDNLKKNLQLKDIYKLDYALLLVCIAEIDYLNEELGICINEAVRLAKRYSTDKSPSFINGVLSSIYKKV